MFDHLFETEKYAYSRYLNSAGSGASQIEEKDFESALMLLEKKRSADRTIGF